MEKVSVSLGLQYQRYNLQKTSQLAACGLQMSEFGHIMTFSFSRHFHGHFLFRGAEVGQMCQEEERGDDLIMRYFCLGMTKRTPGQVLTCLDAKTRPKSII